MSYLFNTFLYDPLFSALVFVYQNIAFQDIGFAIIILTVLIRFILYPLFYKSMKNQTLLQKIQPHIEKIQHDHKDNKEKQAEALLALYKEHKVNPFSGILLLFIQLPVLIALYRVFLTGFESPLLISFNPLFLGLINLQNPSIIMVVLAVVSQYIQTKLSLPKVDPNQKSSPASQISRNMAFIGPGITALILFNLPAAIGLYWVTTSVFSIIQQIYINKKLNTSPQSLVANP